MKLSIITVNRNNASGLKKTIQSVAVQTFTDFEYIVIDGASDDGSVEIIKKYADKITYWVSEPDTGIYNAMNKGIRKAQGNYCLFLNSGDYLIEPATLQNVFDEIARCEQADIYYSYCIKSDCTYTKTPKHITVNSFIFGNSINHQNSIISHSLFLEHGFYNEELKIASDREFWLRETWKYKSRFFYIDTTIAIYDITGISTNKDYSDELIIIMHNIFGELSNLIIELINYHNSVYHDIIRNYGNSKFLDFILKSYRYIVRKVLPKIIVKKNLGIKCQK
jgi:glycosyltransferase involved in cell wall biosynthesis